MYNIKPIGIVRNDITNRSGMSTPGTKSTIEIYPEYIEGLKSLENNSHIVILCYLHQARRETLIVTPKKSKHNLGTNIGVFATRSPDRPNPISVSVVKLLSINNNILDIDKLDSIDGTPVIDIKPYLPDNDK